MKNLKHEELEEIRGGLADFFTCLGAFVVMQNNPDVYSSTWQEAAQVYYGAGCQNGWGPIP